MRFCKALLILFVVFALPAPGQDVTCNSGDIAWVVDTENANEGIVGGGGTAEYNNTAAAWGIQAAIDERCVGLEIRIVHGANTYGSASTSWTSRDDASKDINVDGTIDDFDIVGYATTSLACTAFTQANCPVVMNFSAGTGDGFDALGGVQNWSFQWIHVQNAALDGMNVNGTERNAIIYSEFSANGDKGIEMATGGETLIFGSRFHDNTGDQLFGSVGTRMIGNSAYNCGATNPCINVDTGIAIKNIAIGQVPFEISGNAAFVALNTVRCTGAGDGIANTGSQVRGIYYGNIFENCANALNFGANGQLLIANNVYDTVTDQLETVPTPPRIVWDGDDAANENGSATTCDFTSASDSNQTLCLSTLLLDFANTAGTETHKAGGLEGASAGGGGTSIAIMGVR